LRGIFRAVNGVRKRSRAACENALYHARACAESRRTLGGVEYAEASAGSCAHVNEPAARLKCFLDRCYGTRNVRQFAPNGGSDARIFAIQNAENLQRRFSIEPARVQVALFGFRVFQEIPSKMTLVRL
jgi:hypothetical protein